MRNAKRCGCSFSQSNTSCVGERIRVNNGCSCHSACNDRERGQCENSCRPRPCPRSCPRPCPRPCSKPCSCPRPCPSCEDRCAAQYRNCMRNCRWEREDDCDCGCGCGNRRNFDDEFFEESECEEEHKD